MADYTVRIEATTEEAEKKLKRVDDRVEKLERGATIDIRVPSAQETLSVLGKVASVTATVGKQAFQISRAANIGPGAVVNDLVEIFGLVSSGGKKAVSAMEMLQRATPSNILGTAFSVASQQATSLSRNIAAVGYEIFGLTQSVNILQQAFGGLFNETIGREIRLQESLLRTRTTLVSTADVAVNGKRLTDPYEALMALEGPVDEALENIRRRSLDIAGTTSDAIVQMFGVVASQVGQFGGDLKDAEDLAITFAGALGTIGMSDPNLAVQEVRSILTGTVDQNSVLARSLGLTNEQIQKAKTSAEGLTGFLIRRLEAFTAGQKIAAQGFAGVVSNIQEVREEASRSLGKPLLQPLLEGLTAVYERLGLVFDQILDIADAFGRIGATAFAGVMSGIKAAPLLEGFSERDQIEAFKRVEEAVVDALLLVQEEIDKLRPLIAKVTNEAVKAVAMLSTGLGNLAKGFASFKYAELQVIVQSYSGLASLLNSTVIPLLTQVLNLYGQILSQPVFQYITRIQVQMGLLEKIGVMSVVRLAYYWQFAFKESVMTAIGWITKLASAVKTGVTAIVNGIASTISNLGQIIERAGTAVINGVTAVTQALLNLVINLSIKIRASLISLGLELVSSLNPIVERIGIALVAVGNAFGSIERGAQRAKIAVESLGIKGRLAMMQLGLATDKAADATRNLGAALAVQLGGAIKALGARLAVMAWGMIKFQLVLLAIQAAIGVVTDAVGRFTRRNDELSSRTRAELALKRLTTQYANLGENASLAAKAMKKVEEVKLSNRAEKLDKAIQKRAKEYQAAREKLAQIDQYNARLAETKTYGGVSTVLPTPENELRTIKDYERLLDERQKIRDYFERQEQQGKDQENVQVLARERQDIETALGEVRKDLERELADERFRTTRELARLEQSLKEEGRRAERAELERRLAREQQDLVGVRADIAQVLAEYEKGLFDAQTEAQRRQFEQVEARENLEKSIADYKFKLEEQTTRLRKRIGDYNKEVADYETKQAERREKIRMRGELEATARQVERYILTPSEINKFKDAAAGMGVSSTKALAWLKTPGVLEQLGIAPGGDPKQLMAELLKRYPFLAASSKEDFVDILNQRTAVIGSGAGQLIYNTAISELNNGRDFQRAVPPPPKLKGFSGFEAEQQQMVNERKVLGDRILDQTARLNELLTKNTLTENFTNLIEALKNPSRLTNLPTPEAAAEALEQTRAELNLFNEALARGTTKLSLFDTEISNANILADRMIDQFSKSEAFNSFFIDAQGKGALTDEQRTLWANAIRASSEASIKNGRVTLGQNIEAAAANNPQLRQAVEALITGILEAFNRINRSAPLAQQNQELAAFAQSYKQFFEENKNFVRDGILEASAAFGQLATENSPYARRVLEAERINARRTADAEQNGLLGNPDIAEGLARMNEATLRSYSELGRFEEELKGVTERLTLARELTTDFINGTKNVIRAAIDGSQSITDAAYQALEALSDRIIDTFLSYALRPLQQVIEENFRKIFNVDDPAALEKAYREKALAAQEKTAGELGKTATVIENANTSVNNLKTSIDTLAAKIGDTVTDSITSPIATATGGGTTGVNTEGVQKELDATQKSAADLNANVKQASDNTEDADPKTKDLVKNLGVAAGAVAGLGMMVAGIEGMKEGGTYNTLMGIAAVFGGIASITGSFAALGKRASGGPVRMKTPYLVGERGPELFIPENNGTVIPNGRTAALQASRAALGGSRPGQTPEIEDTQEALRAQQMLTRERQQQRTLVEAVKRPSSMDIRYQSEVINNVNYVTAEQFERGMYDAAQRGRALTLQMLSNSVSTRRKLGIS